LLIQELHQKLAQLIGIWLKNFVGSGYRNRATVDVGWSGWGAMAGFPIVVGNWHTYS
jgi:hypothetical protein